MDELIDFVKQRENISAKVKERFIHNIEKFRRDFDV